MTMRCAASLTILGCLLLACGNDDTKVTPTPDTTSSSGTSAGGSDGSGGAGGNATTSTGSGGSGASGGSSTTDDGQSGYVSGSRLKARFYQGGDGSKYFTGMWDSELGVECVPRAHFTDDSVRCMPKDAALMQFLYTDAACTQAVAYGSDSFPCGLPDYAMTNMASNGCDPPVPNDPYRYLIREIISPIAKPAQAWVFNGIDCYSIAVPSVSNYYSLGPALPPSAFVEMSLTNE